MRVADLKKPPVKRTRGRPKGRDLTAIGLPKRRRRDGPQKFRVRPPLEREKGSFCLTVGHGVCSKKSLVCLCCMGIVLYVLYNVDARHYSAIYMRIAL